MKHGIVYSEKEKIAFLYNVIQYVERQVVLLDALEEAAFDKIYDTIVDSVFSSIFCCCSYQYDPCELL